MGFYHGFDHVLPRSEPDSPVGGIGQESKMLGWKVRGLRGLPGFLWI